MSIHKHQQEFSDSRSSEEGGFGLMILVFFFLIFSATVVLGISQGIISGLEDTRQYTQARQAFYTAESSVEDVLYRFNQSDLSYDAPEVLRVAGEKTTTTIQTLSATKRRLIARSEFAGTFQNISVSAEVQAGTSFGSGVQAGQGGFTFDGGTEVIGNVYSNGPVVGGYRQDVTGDVVSAGPNGLIDNVEVGGDAYANEIANTDVGGDAYYQNLTNTIVSGTKHPGSSDQSLASFPISDETIEQWKTDAEDGGVYTGSCPYNPGFSDAELGNVKIECDLNIASSADVTLTGPVWVDGDITVGGGAAITIDPSLGPSSVAVIADEEGSSGDGGVIDISGGADIEGTGEDSSHIFFISQNNDAENDGGTDAIELGGGVGGDIVLYASHGSIALSGGVDAVQLTGYRIEMSGGADLVYEEGLKSVQFSGAQGRWGVNAWQEIE